MLPGYRQCVTTANVHEAAKTKVRKLSPPPLGAASREVLWDSKYSYSQVHLGGKTKTAKQKLNKKKKSCYLQHLSSFIIISRKILLKKNWKHRYTEQETQELDVRELARTVHYLEGVRKIKLGEWGGVRKKVT